MSSRAKKFVLDAPLLTRRARRAERGAILGLLAIFQVHPGRCSVFAPATLRPRLMSEAIDPCLNSIPKREW
jgi:hypothetical protein